MRVRWLHACANSVPFSINGGAAIDLNDSNYEPPRWHWNPLFGVNADKRFKLKKGKNSFKLFNREDGAEVDQILLTTSEVVPQDVERGGGATE